MVAPGHRYIFDRGIDGTQKSSLLSVNAIEFETMIANQRIANLSSTENTACLVVASFVIPRDATAGGFLRIVIIVLNEQPWAAATYSTPGTNERSFISLSLSIVYRIVSK